MTLAKKKNIPEEYLGVRFDYHKYPFEIEVFSYRPFPSDDPNNFVLEEDLRTDSITSFANLSYFPMVAKEAVRRSQEGRRCVMLVVVHYDGRELPSLAYLGDSTPPLPDLEHAKLSEIESHYVDRKGNKLRPGEGDTLGTALKLAQARLQKDADVFWAQKKLYEIADEVLNV